MIYPPQGETARGLAIVLRRIMHPPTCTMCGDTKDCPECAGDDPDCTMCAATGECPECGATEDGEG